MDWVWDNPNASVNLLVGGALSLVALLNVLRPRSILRMVLWLIWLSFGAALIAVGLLNLRGLIASEWVNVSQFIVLGIGLTWTSIAALKFPPSPSAPRWTQWATLVMGVGWVFFAMVHVLNYFWH